MALTDRAAKNARPRPDGRSYKLADGGGMYLLCAPTGAKYWRLKYRYAGKEKLLALGVYPQVSLVKARSARQAAKDALLDGRDPAAEKRSEKREGVIKASNTFEVLGREWWEKKRGGWSKAHADAVLDRLEKQLFPRLGPRPIAELEAPDVLEVLRTIEDRDKLELLSKTRIVAGQVFRYAIVTGRAKSDPTAALRGAFKTREVKHYAKLSEADLPDFLKKLATFDGSLVTKYAIQLLLLTFLRTGELRGARWSEFDLDKRDWRVPGARMKSGRDHMAPLSRQAVAILKELKKITGGREHLFPNEHKPRSVMSENTILFALYRMGYQGRATGHGMRGTASTILNEQGWRRDVIERQLDHADRDQVRAAYNTAEYLPERRKMMQAWADYLDAMASGAKVTSIKRTA